MAESQKGSASAIPKELNCLVCHLPLNEPVMIKDCGHRICLVCMVEDVLRNPNPLCPKDNTPITYVQMFDIDNVRKEKICEMLIKCPNTNCPWMGKVLDFESHVLFDCKDTLPPFSEKCGDESDKPEGEMEGPVAKDCSEELLSCAFEDVGCLEKIESSQLEHHMKHKMARHLELNCLRVKQQEQRLQVIKSQHSTQLKQTKTRLEQQMALCMLEKSKNSFTWGAIIFLKRRLMAEGRLFSKPFFLHGYRMIIILSLRELEFSIFASSSHHYLRVGFHIIKGKFDKELQWPFKKTLVFRLVMQGDSRYNSLAKVSLQPNEAVKMPEGQIDNKWVVKKPMTNFAYLSLIKYSFTYNVQVEFAAEQE